MKEMVFRVLSLLSLVIFVSVLTATGCSTPPCKDAGDCLSGQACTDGKCVADTPKTDGGIETTTPDTVNNPDKTPPKDEVNNPGDKQPPKDETPKEATPGETTPDKPTNNNCPPGCDTCKKLSEGSPCKNPSKVKGTPRCPTGFVCAEIGSGGAGYCLKSCRSGNDCGNGTTCRQTGNTACDKLGLNDIPCVCGTETSQQGDICNYSEAKFCASGYTCLISDQTETAGTCAQNCANDPKSCGEGLVCKAVGSSQFCADPLCPGYRKLHDTCSTASTRQNCSKEFTCSDEICLQNCKTAKDCDTSKKETCELVAFGKPRNCQAPPSVKKEGEPCSALKRCDPSLGLVCLDLPGGKFCTKRCKAAGDCSKNQVCEKVENSQRLPFTFCRDQSKTLEPCNKAQKCIGKIDTCLRFTETTAFCVQLCARTNADGDQENHPDCGGGKYDCSALSGSTSRDGKTFNGFCYVRDKTAKVGEACDSGLGKKSCAKGGRCYQGYCYETCSPCDSKKDATGEWKNTTCGAHPCDSLYFSDGRYAFSICNSGPGSGSTGKKLVIGKNERCGDDPDKDCKKGLRCIRFSGDETVAQCLPNCDPKKSGSPECVKLGDDRCAQLTDGSGVCIPKPKRTREYGQSCSGDLGTPGFDDCKEKTKDGKALRCSRPLNANSENLCRYACNPTKGIVDNPDCKAVGQPDSLCLPRSLREPENGACHKKCVFKDRAQCLCPVGQCQNAELKTGGCNAADCAKTGGKCVGNRCIAVICN